MFVRWVVDRGGERLVDVGQHHAGALGQVAPRDGLADAAAVLAWARRLEAVFDREPDAVARLIELANEGGGPDKIDESKVKGIEGVIRVVRLPYGVGVLADTPWAVFEARRALAPSVTWSRTGTAWGFDSDKGMERFAADAKNPTRGATEWSKIGDVRGELPKAAGTMEAEYRCDYAYHAQMEPLNAIAAVSPAGDSVEIWAGTQSQTTPAARTVHLLQGNTDGGKLCEVKPLIQIVGRIVFDIII